MKAWLPWLEERLLAQGAATSSALFALLSLPTLIVLWGLQAYALHDPRVTALYVPPFLRASQWLLTGMIVLLLGVIVMAWRERHAVQAPSWLAPLAVTPTFLGLLLLSWGYGMKDTPMWMALLQEMVLARALLPARVLKPCLALALAVAAGSEFTHLALHWPYAPLLSAPVFFGHDMHWWWGIWLRVMFDMSVLPFAGMVFFFFRTLHRRRKELESLVRTDVLTGLSNRREFMARLDIESHRHARNGRPFCLVLCDVDHFKKVNDTWGHPVGDEVLAALGQILKGLTRERVDVAARIGGEEFVLLLPETELPGARMVAQKISDALRSHVFTAHGARFVVTQSVGIAEVHDGQGEYALRVADQNLYEAKRSGRDVIVGSVVPAGASAPMPLQ